jgi:hypothetical protein
MMPRPDVLAVLVAPLVLVVVSLVGWVGGWPRYPSPGSRDEHKSDQRKPASQPRVQPRVLKARPPDDCPLCRGRGGGSVNQDDATSAGGATPEEPPAPTAPIPYPQVRSRRGRQKRLSTAGYACPNPACMYAGITDESVHALVGYGGMARRNASRFSSARPAPLPPASGGGGRGPAGASSASGTGRRCTGCTHDLSESGK